MAQPVYRVETVADADYTSDLILAARLNAIAQTGGKIVSVLPIACVKPLTDPVSGEGLYHWFKIVWTS